MKAQLSVKSDALGLPQHSSDVRALFSQLSIALLSSDPRRQKRARMITSAPIANFALLFTNSLANFIAKHERTAYRDHRFHRLGLWAGGASFSMVDGTPALLFATYKAKNKSITLNPLTTNASRRLVPGEVWKPRSTCAGGRTRPGPLGLGSCRPWSSLSMQIPEMRKVSFCPGVTGAVPCTLSGETFGCLRPAARNSWTLAT